MQLSEPVLTDPDDIRIWNKICDIDRKEKKKIRQHDKLSVLAVINDALTTMKQMHSAVLVKMLRMSAKEEVGDLESIAIKILDLCKPSDMYPIMEAIDIVIKCGNLDVSGSLMKKLADVPDTAFKEYLEGMLALRSGDSESAMNHLIRSNAIDSSFIRTYDALISIDPGKGWDVLKNIPLIMSGEAPEPVQTYDRELLELQDIYKGWYGSDKGNARKRLELSEGYTSGHLDFLLAAARITGDVGEYKRSSELYGLILSKYPNIDSIIVEKANILSSMGKRNDALVLLEAMGGKNDNNRNVAECMLKILASKSTEKEFIACAERFLRSEHGDRSAYILVCDLMSRIRLNKEAADILHMLIPMFPNDVDVHLMNARNEIMLGRDTVALRAADTVIKLSPKTADGYCIKAEIRLRQGRTRDAVMNAERALKNDGDHIASLSVMKDIRIRTKEYAKALEICRRILILDPMNAYASKDMAYSLDMLGKLEEAIEEYKHALRMKNDTQMLSSILSLLIESERMNEASEIAKEFVDDESGPDLWGLRGNAEYGSADFNGAAASFSKALETLPHDARQWHSKGLAEEMAGRYSEAESSYDRAMIFDLDNTEYWLSKAMIQEKRGDLKGAVLSLNRVIADSPENVFALVRKSQILAYAGKTEEAMFFLDHALKVDGRNVKVLDIKKNICKRDGMHERTIEVCKAILKADKKNLGALTDMAEAYQMMGKHDEALKVLDNVSSGWGEIGILTMKKNSARLKGDLDLEIETCRSILSIEPNDRAVKLELADALTRNGDYNAAMKIYNEIQTKDPKDAEVIVLRGKLKAMAGDGSSAVALYHEAILEDPDNCDVLNELANALCESREYKQALNMISRAVELSPEVPKVHLTRSAIYYAMGNTRDALDALNEALNDVSEKGEIYLHMGSIQSESEDYDDALISYDSAIRNGFDDSGTYYRRGYVQEKLGSREAAKKSYSVSSTIDPGNVRALERLGTMQLEDGEYAAARKNLDSALNADPFDTPSLLSCARLYVKEGNEEKAIPIYRTLSSRDDSTAEIAEELSRLLEKKADDHNGERTHTRIRWPGRRTVSDHDDDDTDSTAHTKSNDNEIYSLAISVLEYAYETGSAISDDHMLSELGIDEDTGDTLLEYLSNIEEYGDIDTSTKEFEKMERLSRNLIINEHLDNIDSNPLVSIPAAFMASEAETIDEAKRLIAYIYRAITDDSEPVAFSQSVRDAAAGASEMTGDINTYTIMRLFNVGIYAARTIDKLSKKGKKGTSMHI
ncbi:MAG: tetratricopeptide repeat protein [Methanomassiliicoccaceae archaeon]|nr:tetratricopeptide repeat protein [Methanomassiliicoccaceae archaeon]